MILIKLLKILGMFITLEYIHVISIYIIIPFRVVFYSTFLNSSSQVLIKSEKNYYNIFYNLVRVRYLCVMWIPEDKVNPNVTIFSGSSYEYL